jgi:F0F1-type ATP synthase assembly protein I
MVSQSGRWAPVSGNCRADSPGSLTQFSGDSRLAVDLRLTTIGKSDRGNSMLSGDQSEKQRRSRASQIAQAYRAAHEVVSAAMSVGLLVLGGFWLDRKYAWTPVLTVCGALLGFFLAGVSLRQLLRRLDYESARKKQKPSESREARSE